MKKQLKYLGEEDASSVLNMSFHGEEISICTTFQDASAHVLVAPRVKRVTYMIGHLEEK